MNATSLLALLPFSKTLIITLTLTISLVELMHIRPMVVHEYAEYQNSCLVIHLRRSAMVRTVLLRVNLHLDCFVLQVSMCAVALVVSVVV